MTKPANWSPTRLQHQIEPASSNMDSPIFMTIIVVIGIIIA